MFQLVNNVVTVLVNGSSANANVSHVLGGTLSPTLYKNHNLYIGADPQDWALLPLQ